jgi:hypothetical protein
MPLAAQPLVRLAALPLALDDFVYGLRGFAAIAALPLKLAALPLNWRHCRLQVRLAAMPLISGNVAYIAVLPLIIVRLTIAILIQASVVRVSFWGSGFARASTCQ